MTRRTELYAEYVRRARRQRLIGHVLSIARHLALGVLCLFALAPLLWAISTSFKPQTEVYTNTGLIPYAPTASNYVYVLSKTQFGLWFWNTVRVALATTVLAIAVATLGGYAMSRFRFVGRGLYGNILLIVQMFPGVMLGIPLFLLFARMKLVNTLESLLITYMTFALAFAVWMLKGYFDAIPKEIEEAARIDGASDLGVLWRIILPLASPGITTVAVYAFLLAWNDFFFAYILLAKNQTYTLQIGLYTFINQFFTQWEYLMPAAVLTTIPVLFFFFALQRYLTRGLIAGATKG